MSYNWCEMDQTDLSFSDRSLCLVILRCDIKAAINMDWYQAIVSNILSYHHTLQILALQSCKCLPPSSPL